LEATFGLKRESLGMTPEEDGTAVYRQIAFREGDVTIDATKAGRGGYTIPPTIAQSCSPSPAASISRGLSHPVDKFLEVQKS
jgi:DNA topoisomerase VI subunit A